MDEIRLVDEVKLFEELQPPPPPDAARMREAARARLAAAMSAPPACPARRRNTVVAAAAAAALVAAGAGYGLTASPDGSGSLPGGGPGSLPGTATRGSSTRPATAAGLTAVRGCPGMYITAGTLEQVSGTRLILQPANDHDHVNRAWRAKPVTVATSASTAVTRPVSGTVSDITDGSHVVVQGTWSGKTLAATQVGIEAALPPLSSFGPHVPRNAPKLGKLGAGVIPPKLGQFGPGLIPPVVSGTVADAHDGRFTVVTQAPSGLRVQVVTSGSTTVVAKATASLSQLDLGSDVVAVGQIGSDGVLTAGTVTEPSVMEIVLAGGPAKLRTSSCSASAITAAAIQAGV